MSEFKKSFRGYNITDVDEKIKEFEAKLLKSERQREELENHIYDVEKALDNSRKQAEHSENELERLKAEYDSLLAKENLCTNTLKSVGRIYVKAYESGRKLVDAPITHIDRMMTRLSQVFDEAGERCVNSQKTYDDVYSRAQTIVDELSSLAEGVMNSIAEVGLRLEEVKRVCDEVGSIKDATAEDVERIKLSYRESVSDYINSDSVRDSAQKDDFASTSGDICDDDATNNLQDSFEKPGIPGETEERQSDATPVFESVNTAEDFIMESEKFHGNSDGEISSDTVADGGDETHRGQYVYYLLNKYQKSSKDETKDLKMMNNAY